MKDILFFYGLINKDTFRKKYFELSDRYLDNLNHILAYIIYTYYYIDFKEDELTNLVYPLKITGTQSFDKALIDECLLLTEFETYRHQGEVLFTNNKKVVFDNAGIISVIPTNSPNVINETSMPLRESKKRMKFSNQNAIFLQCNSNEQNYVYKSRFYLMLKEEYRKYIIDELCSTLNGFSIPFTVKMIINNLGYSRCDTTIIYTNPNYCNLFVEIITGIRNKFSNYFDNCELNFAQKIIPGVFFGESPVASKSFGLHRSQAFASMLSNILTKCEKNELDFTDYNTVKDEVLSSYGIHTNKLSINTNYQTGYYRFI